MSFISSIFKSFTPPPISIDFGSGQRITISQSMASLFGGPMSLLHRLFGGGRNHQQMSNVLNSLSNRIGHHHHHHHHHRGGVASGAAADLRKSLNSAERNYEGNDWQVNKGFRELDKLDAELQREIKKLGRHPSRHQLNKVKRMAAALADKIEDLKNQPGLEYNRQILNQLDKAENAANDIYREMKDKIHHMKPPIASKPADELKKALNKAEKSYCGNDCQVKHGFKEVDRLDAQLQREIKKLGRHPSRYQLNKVKRMAAALADKIEDLKNQPGLEGNDEVLNQLDKAENAANSVYREVENKLDTMKPIASKPATDLRKSLNSAERNYTGNDWQVNKGFRQVDRMDAELQREIKKLGRHPSRYQLHKVKRMAAALADKIEDLKNQPGLEGNHKVLGQLDKAEKAANDVYKDVKNELKYGHHHRPEFPFPRPYPIWMGSIYR
jgi:DNA polymerase/3'-5' exonuclease PolX